MRLTPLDIKHKQFAKALRGVEEQEVRAFLDVCADEVEDLVRETAALKEEVRARDALLAETRDRERALQEALVSAQRLAQEMKDQARKEAEIIVAEAEVQGEKIVQDAHNRRTTLIGELGELRSQKVTLEAELRATLEGHLRLLEALSDEAGADGRVTLFQKRDGGRKETA